MATLEIAAKYIAKAMNGENELNQAQRDGFQAIAGKIVNNVIMARMLATGEDRLTVASYTVDEVFETARKLINQWDRDNNRTPRYV